MLRMPCILALLPVSWLAAACDYSCPRGYTEMGDRCYLIRKDAAAEEAAEGEDGGQDGAQLQDGAEPQDSGASLGSRGDSGSSSEAGMSGESGPTMVGPEIQGASSMAPGRELWTWTVPAGTDHFELLLNGVAPAGGGEQADARFSPRLELGDYTLEVRACSADQRCSDWSSHTTRVERFGAERPRGLRDAARVFPATALGHVVAVGCNDCADGPNSELYNFDQAAASVERAVARGADLLELNVASIGGSLYASPADSPDAGARPLLANLLRKETIANADALIVLEVVEDAAVSPVSPDEFAEAFFSVVDAVPSVARNGRPLWLRTNYANRSYLRALAEASEQHAATGPYIRFVLSDPGRDPAAFYGAADDTLVPSLGFLDAVSVDFRLPNLAFRLERIRAAGAAVIVENVPGPGHGELVLGALREQADAFLTNYRVDQARRVVSQTDTVVSFGASDISVDGRVLSLHGARSTGPVTWEQELGGRRFPDRWFSAAQVYQTPRALTDASAATFFGPYLSFELQEVATALLVSSSDAQQEPAQGFLLSFFGTLRYDNPIDTFSIVSSQGLGGAAVLGLAEKGVFGQVLRSSGDSSALSVPFRGATERCFSANQAFSGDLDIEVPHWVVFAHSPAQSTLVLLVDGKCAETAQIRGEELNDLLAEILIGGGILTETYRGFMQTFHAFRWAPAANDSQN